MPAAARLKRTRPGLNPTRQSMRIQAGRTMLSFLT